MNKEQKNRSYALICTIVFHSILVLILLFLALKTPLPLPGEEGVEVNLGYSEVGMGRPQPPTSQPEAASPPQTSRPSSVEDLVTQQQEETIALPAKKEPKPQPKPEPPKPIQPKPEPEPEPPKVDPRAIFRGSGNQTSSGQNEGITGQPGDQGQPTGSTSSSNYDGQGGAGEGISFSLEGRSATFLPKPDYASHDQGRVVVTIYVNRLGVVTRVVGSARGTTTADPILRRAAENAAMRARFSPNPNATEEQIGTITYNFIRLN
ncbi:MAG: energy transducer TonB [Bacteroidales bacterium]|nr:energy transducer TonB [Bacteroidales bacterium]MDZ4205269.1 energy transducer TonB [Bacteroidales bacterium]